MTESNNHVLSKKDLTKLALRTLFLQASFNYERMQAGGWTYAMLPSLRKIHKNDDKELSNSMKDNLEFINTHPNLVGLIMGLLLSLEEQKENRNTIRGLKVALFPPLAGIGDSILWFTILPILVGLSSSFAANGNILGPILFFVAYLILFLLRIPLTHAGYNLGINAIEKIKRQSQAITKSATILGITVIGGLIATYVKIELLPEIPVGEGETVSLQEDFLDTIFPKILPLGFTFLLYYLLKKKQLNPAILILFTFVLVLILSALGVL